MHLRSFFLFLLFLAPGLYAAGQEQTLRATETEFEEEPAADQGEALKVYRERVRRLLIEGDYEEVLRLTKEFERVFPNNKSLSVYRNRAERRIDQSQRQNLLSGDLGGDFVLPSLSKAALPTKAEASTSSKPLLEEGLGLSLLEPEIEIRDAARDLAEKNPGEPKAAPADIAIEPVPAEIESPAEEAPVREKRVAVAEPPALRKARSRRNPLPFPLWIGLIGVTGGAIIAFFLWRMRRAQSELREMTQDIAQTKKAQSAEESSAAAPNELEFEEASAGGGLFGDGSSGGSSGGAAGIDPITGEDSSPPSSLFDPIVSRNPEDDLFSLETSPSEPTPAPDSQVDRMELTPGSPLPQVEDSDAPIELGDITSGTPEEPPAPSAAAPESDPMPMPSETSIDFESLPGEAGSMSAEDDSLAGSTSEDPFSLINLTLPPEHSSESSSPGDTSSPEMDDIPQLPDESQIVATTPTEGAESKGESSGTAFEWDDSELNAPSLDAEPPEARPAQSLEASAEAPAEASLEASGKESAEAPLEFEIGDADTDVGLDSNGSDSGRTKKSETLDEPGSPEIASPAAEQGSPSSTKDISDVETVFDISEALGEPALNPPPPVNAAPDVAANVEPTGSESPTLETVASAALDLASDSFGDTGEVSSQEEIDRFTFKTHSGLGIQFMGESNWDKAVYHLSIASAIEPGDKEIKGHLRTSRRMRKSPEAE